MPPDAPCLLLRPHSRKHQSRRVITLIFRGLLTRFLARTACQQGRTHFLGHQINTAFLDRQSRKTALAHPLFELFLMHRNFLKNLITLCQRTLNSFCRREVRQVRIN